MILSIGEEQPPTVNGSTREEIISRNKNENNVLAVQLREE